MKIWALDDGRYRWGPEVVAAARRRSIAAGLFTGAAQVLRDRQATLAAVLRLAQRPPRWQADVDILRMLAAAGVKTVPGPRLGLVYEDKVLQAELFPEWLPETWIIRRMDQVDRALDALGLPLISKSASEAGSFGVRFIETEEQARAEARQALTGAGIQNRYNTQTGYLLWQRFMADNGHDWRVIIVGPFAILKRRHNRPGTPLASGSGVHDDMTAPSLPADAREFLAHADKFARAQGSNWCALDLVRDHQTGRPVILEASVAWPTWSYDACRFYRRSDGAGLPIHGRQLWPTVIDLIVSGTIFDEPPA